MEPANIERLTAQLRRELGAAPDARPHAAPFTVPAVSYRDEALFARERAALFGGPRIVAASASILPNTAVPIDVPGIAALVTRTSDGELRAFANACRHRGTRLADAPCTKA